MSDRELEVFRRIGPGLGTRQIADQLHLSVKTVESYRTHIKEKLELSSSVDLVRCAIEWRIETERTPGSFAASSLRDSLRPDHSDPIPENPDVRRLKPQLRVAAYSVRDTKPDSPRLIAAVEERS